MSFKRFVKNFVAWFSDLRKSQRKTLAALVYGLMKSRRVGVAAIARGIYVACKFKKKITYSFGLDGLA
ncbi:hypothetical protein [Thermanaeromonas sp. C210]|uniref:hypothetical protein n=1 Tax=Thermanaeromonas sp. C210 TaxID=2731925 RepID=UPI00155B72F9|nr:hypothetical protein [Thermanaeromonas sp. C210]GFN23736.1 hypothetical protein TAMC210_20530 [Thermanaeromonas sp. C210]